MCEAKARGPQAFLIAILGLLLASACTQPAPLASPTPPTKATVAPQATTAPDKKEAAAKRELTPLKAGVTGAATDAGFYIAKEKGYFVDEGIDAEIVEFDTAQKMVPALGTEQIEVGGGGTNAGLYNAIAREVLIRVVADKGSMPAGQGHVGMLARKDLVDSGTIKTFSDLKGRTIAVNETGNVSHYIMNAALAKGGLTEKDVNTVTMRFPDMIAALQNKAIDGAIANEPVFARAEKLGAAVRWKRGDEIVDNHQVAVVFYSQGFATQRVELARRFMIAYLRGVRDYNDAFLKNKGKSEVVNILMKNTSIKDAATYDEMIVGGINPDGTMNKEGMARELDWYVQREFVKTKPSLDNLVDDQFIKYAVEKLGKYSR